MQLGNQKTKQKKTQEVDASARLRESGGGFSQGCMVGQQSCAGAEPRML